MKIEKKLNLISFLIEISEPFAVMVFMFFSGLAVVSIFEIDGTRFYTFLIWLILTVSLVVLSSFLRSRLASREILEQIPNDFGQYLLDKTSKPINYVYLGKLWKDFCFEQKQKSWKQESSAVFSAQKKAIESRLTDATKIKKIKE